MHYESVQDVTWLFNFAKTWYSNNPGEQIPLDAWMNTVCQAVDASDPWIIYDGAHSVRPASHHIIPALAAISLGATPAELVDILKHHETECNHISQTSFDQVSKPDPGHEGLSSWKVNHLLVDAMMIDEELSKKFKDEDDEYGLIYDLELAWLLCDHAKFLPVERIEKHLSDIKQGTVDPWEKVRDVSTCHVFLRASSGFKTLSDEVILKALVRSGNLTLGLTRENGFVLGSAYGFFRDLLLSMNESPRNKNAERIFEVLNNVQDIQMVATIKARILESFMEFDARSASGALFLECMARFLDDSRYGELRQNMTLNLILFNVRQLEVLQAHGSEVFYGNPLIKQLGNSAGSILQSLLSELKALNPRDFRLPHFCAISTLVDNSTMLDEPIDNLWPELLFVALHALDAYRETPHHKGYAKIQGANQALESLIRHVAMAKDIDYKSFATLASGSKVLLASNGFDIKKLPGMTPRHRGQVLSDQLGL